MMESMSLVFGGCLPGAGVVHQNERFKKAVCIPSLRQFVQSGLPRDSDSTVYSNEMVAYSDRILCFV